MIFVLAGAMFVASILGIAFVVRGPWRWWWRLALVAAQPFIALSYLAVDWKPDFCREVLNATGQQVRGSWISLPCLDFLGNLLTLHAVLLSIALGVLLVLFWRRRVAQTRTTV